MKAVAARIAAWIWPLIYGGLFAICIGVALARGGEAYGTGVVVAGAIAAVIGAVLVWVRSRVDEP